ncbi:MAG: nucleoside kinase [Andreesenia angusta]|nr:nucleoside kinase [Andreesenia angusta]
MNMKALIKIKLPDNVNKEVPIGTTIKDILDEKALSLDGDNYIIAAIVNGKAVELFTPIYADSEIKPIRVLDRIGYAIYARSLNYLAVIAASQAFEKVKVRIEHSINNEIYGKLHIGRKLTEEDVDLLNKTMHSIVEEDLPIEKVKVLKTVAESIFKSYRMIDKTSLLKYAKEEYVSLYKCGNVYDYLYGPLVPSMGYLKSFDVNLFDNGFLIRLPEKKEISKISSFRDIPKLRAAFEETNEWSHILKLANVGDINNVLDGDINNRRDMFLVAEGLHEKKISKIADKILENIDNTKLILIAGPSSSGKTTFANRLAIQLRVLGLDPKSISADDYFYDREDTPINENGEYDFESLRALDVNLLNTHLSQLLAKKEIDLIKFNFLKGEREFTGQKYKMNDKSVLIVEGIHGLNEEMTPSIPKENKYKIYVSALTNINLDNHSSIYVSDIRTLRRMIRDNSHRGMEPSETLLAWPSVRAGEEQNIFPYQEEADVIFNSTLVYEIHVLKKYAEPLLKKIPQDHPAYVEARRILKFLRFFKSADDEFIPQNSIMREFIGGTCFE